MKKILIINANYYKDISKNLVLSAKKKLYNAKIKISILNVSGIYEIPYSIRKNIVRVIYDEIHYDEFNDNRFLESIEGAFAKGNNSIQIIFGKTKKDYSKSPQCNVCKSELPKKNQSIFYYNRT